MRLPVAFYAPLKAPDHPDPSGDRTMARLLAKALGAAGFAPELASRTRSYEPAGDRVRQAAIRDAALAEANAIADDLARRPPGSRPRLWFTYHSYYKAPDWIGPRVADRLAIPYVLAEATRARKRAGGPWALAHEGSEAALDLARTVFVLTARDRPALERDRPAGQSLVDLPPFLDLDATPPAPRGPRRAGPARLVAVAMMRPGDKLASYRLLAEALARLGDKPWSLEVVGDGPARPEIEAAFAALAGRVTFRGRVDDPSELAGLYRASDLLVWPAVNEAYGMVLLEAQAQGCPVLAGDFGGVASALQDGRTGLLAPPGDAAAFAAGLGGLLDDPARLAALGAAAARFVRRERSLDAAAAILRGALRPLVAGARAA